MTEWKLQQIPLASFNYRHEAEFAAGFLRDAGIPYRLQIEDPTLGLSATNSATIWVSAPDQKRAQQVLDHDLVVDGEHDEAWAEYSEEEGEPLTDPESEDAAPPATVASNRPRASDRQPIAPVRVTVAKPASDLTLRSRVISLLVGVGTATALLLEAVRQSPFLWWAVALVAVLLALAGLVGRAPGPLRAILQALSGDAP